MSSEALYDGVRDVLRGALGALLVDADVAAVHATERGAVEVTRRGRRERLGVALPSDVFTALRELGAGERALELSLDGHMVRALPAAGERVLLYLEKLLPGDARLAELVEEGVLPEEAALSVLTTARAGHGLIVLGTPRAAARRLAIAVARELADSAPVMSLDDGLDASWLLPSPVVEGGVVERARACERAGAEVLLAPALGLEDARLLAGAALPMSAIVMVRVPSAAAFAAGLRTVGKDALASQVCVLGRAPGGRPVLVEQHMPEGAAAPVAVRAGGAFLPLAAAPSTSAPLVTGAIPSAPEGVLPAPASPAHAPFVEERELPPLPPLGAGPPSGWASSALDDAPGWELDDAKEGPSAFDDVLSRVQARPTFTPRPPPVHPQTRALRGDPFGGLTLEPPGGEMADVDDESADATKADEDER